MVGPEFSKDQGRYLVQHKLDTQNAPKQRKPDDDPLKHPDVVWHRGRDKAGGWSFEPLIWVKPETDLLEMLDRLRAGGNDGTTDCIKITAR